jgi:hypothetical protein
VIKAILLIPHAIGTDCRCRCLASAGGGRQIARAGGATKPAPRNARPQRRSSCSGTRTAPQRHGPSVFACTCCPGPTVTISPARISIPLQSGAGLPPIGHQTRTVLAGTATKATRDTSSSAPARRKRSSVIWVNRARKAPRSVTRIPTHPSARKAASKSLRFAEYRGSATRHIFRYGELKPASSACRAVKPKVATNSCRLAIQFRQKTVEAPLRTPSIPPDAVRVEGLLAQQMRLGPISGTGCYPLWAAASNSEMRPLRRKN